MILLLAGTGEARQLARLLAKEGVPAIATLSGATREPANLGLPTFSGGFGGQLGFEQFLTDHKITSVLDATHPFAAEISRRTARICKHRRLDQIQLLRAPWLPQSGDNWTMLDDESDAAKYIANNATVFLATGRQTLEKFQNLNKCRVFCRQIDPPTGKFPFHGGEFLVGRPPFSVQEEVDLFSRLKLDWLVVKNAGGIASRSKLDAARLLKLPVAMIKRPAAPDCGRVETVPAAMDWVRGLGW